MIYLNSFAGQNWMITPAALAVGEHAPASIHDQLFQLTLSGVVLANLEGNSGSTWLQETVSFLPDMSGPLNWAISRWGIPKPPNTVGYSIAFSLTGWAPYVSLASVFNQNESINSGFAVDRWAPTPFGTGTDAITHAGLSNLFNGVNADVAIRDTDAWIYRLNYNITLLGKIVFPTAPIIQST